jgi:hypothetical protein
MDSQALSNAETTVEYELGRTERPDMFLEVPVHFNAPSREASFASARYGQPGAARGLDILSGHPPEIIRKHSRDRGPHVFRFAETSKRSYSGDVLGDFRMLVVGVVTEERRPPMDLSRCPSFCPCTCA